MSGRTEQSGRSPERATKGSTKERSLPERGRSECAKRVEAKGWKEIPIGGVIDKAGSAAEYKTGDWRTFKPVRDEKKCVHCLICWMYCPDSSILVKDKKMLGFDYEHCKGCGICASVCPVKCITMKKE